MKKLFGLLGVFVMLVGVFFSGGLKTSYAATQENVSEVKGNVSQYQLVKGFELLGTKLISGNAVVVSQEVKGPKNVVIVTLKGRTGEIYSLVILSNQTKGTFIVEKIPNKITPFDVSELNKLNPVNKAYSSNSLLVGSVVKMNLTKTSLELKIDKKGKTSVLVFTKSPVIIK